jgi:hypothetical protein
MSFSWFPGRLSPPTLFWDCTLEQAPVDLDPKSVKNRYFGEELKPRRINNVTMGSVNKNEAKASTYNY